MSDNTANEDKGYLSISRPRAWFMWFLGASFYFYQFFLQVSVGHLKPELSQAFNVNAEQFGSVMACFLYVYGVMQIPVGLLVDRFGPRRLLTVAVIFCALGSYMFSIADHLWAAYMARVFMGLGASFAVVCTLSISSMWFSSKRFALLVGLMVTVGMLGAAFASEKIASLVETYPWRDVFAYTAYVGIILAVMTYAFLRDRDISDRKRNDLEKNAGLIEGFKYIIGHKQIWLISIYAGLMYLPIASFGELWSGPFLTDGHGLDRDTAGSITKFIFIGFAVGGPLYGYVSDTVKRRNLPMYFAAITTMLALLGVIYSEPNILLLKVLWFAVGFFCSGFIVGLAAIRESTPIIVASTAIGFFNIINTLGGAILQPIIGSILDSQGGSLTNTGEKIFSLLEYQKVLVLLPAFLIVSFIILMFVKETHCKQQA